MNEKQRFVPLVLTVLLALGGIASGQTRRADPNTVYVPVSVKAKKDYVKGLQKENFSLFEDGIEQTVTDFYAEDQPIDMDVILALEALQRGRANLDSSKIREALENFRQQSNPANRYVVEEMPFGANGIFDAISRHITHLAEDSTNARKVVLVLTDGFESSGGSPGKTLQEYAKKLDVAIYMIYCATPGPPTDNIFEVGRGQEIYLNGGTVYEDLTKYTGGRLYQAEADTQLRAQLEELAQEFRSQYVLGFTSTNDAKDGKWRKLQVKMKAPQGFNGVKQKDLKPEVRNRYFVAKVDD